MLLGRTFDDDSDSDDDDMPELKSRKGCEDQKTVRTMTFDDDSDGDDDDMPELKPRKGCEDDDVDEEKGENQKTVRTWYCRSCILHYTCTYQCPIYRQPYHALLVSHTGGRAITGIEGSTVTMEMTPVAVLCAPSGNDVDNVTLWAKFAECSPRVYGESTEKYQFLTGNTTEYDKAKHTSV